MTSSMTTTAGKRVSNLRRRRHTTYDLRSVIIQCLPQSLKLAQRLSSYLSFTRQYAIRMSARDHRAMVNSLLELLSMDAEASPASAISSGIPRLQTWAPLRFCRWLSESCYLSWRHLGRSAIGAAARDL